jgi:uncharacterized protein (TIGR02118 family)
MFEFLEHTTAGLAGQESYRSGGANEVRFRPEAGYRASKGEPSPMIKVSVMYPYAAGARFDHAYYRDRHMPMVKQRLGAACLYYTIDKGIAGGAPGSDPVYVAKCDFVCTSVEAFRAARGPHAQEITGDIANYTDIQPVLQISEVVVERSEA